MENDVIVEQQHDGHNQQLRKRLAKLYFVLILLAYFWAAVWLSFRLPAFVAPNEVLNYEYISVMRQIRGLPNRGLVDVTVRYNEWHQPPVYFIWSGLVSANIPVDAAPNPPPELMIPLNPAFMTTEIGNLNPHTNIPPADLPLYYQSRYAAALLGLLCLSGIFVIGSRIHKPAIALLLIGLIAFQPNFLFFSASINNDMPVTAVSGLALAWGLWITWKKSYSDREAFLFGLFLALSILTKANGIFALAYLGGVGLIMLTNRTPILKLMRFSLMVLLGLIPLWSAWLILNTIRLRDTLGVSGSLPVSQVILEGPRHLLLLIPHLWTIWRSIWLDWSIGEIGYGPPWFYLFSLAIILFSLLGLSWRRIERATLELLFVALCGIGALSFLYFATKALMVASFGFLTPEGRWLLPIWPAIAWVMALGINRWFNQSRFWISLSATLPILLGSLILATFLDRLYPAPEPISAQQAARRAEASKLPPNLTYGPQLTLLDASLDRTERLVAGDPSRPLDLTWQIMEPGETNHLITVQLIGIEKNGQWIPFGHQTSHPGQGSQVLSQWRPNQYLQDTVYLNLSEGKRLNGPTQGYVALWLTDKEDKNRVLPSRDGQQIDPPALIPIVLAPGPEAGLGPAEKLHFPLTFVTPDNGEIQLIYLERAGDQLVLWWEAIKPINYDYTTFVHFLNRSNQLIAQQDGPLNNGLTRVNILQPGDIVRDVRPIPPDETIEQVSIGFYDPATGVRLQAFREGNLLPDSAFTVQLPAP
ncbi:MAG: hypothetical protein AAF633_03385 [Chloroflexota bacterium]